MPASSANNLLSALATRWRGNIPAFEAMGVTVNAAALTNQFLGDLDAVMESLTGECVAQVAPPDSQAYAPTADVRPESVALCRQGEYMAEQHVDVTVVDAWHFTPKGCLSCSITRGDQRALIMQRVAKGPYYLRTEGPDKNRQVPVSLRTRDQEQALRLAGAELSKAAHRATATHVLDGVERESGGSGAPSPAPTADAGPLTMTRLIDAYWQGADFAANDAATKASKTSAARILLGHFGGDRPVEDLTHDEFRRYELRRAAGGIEYIDYDATPTGRVYAVTKTTGPVKKRAVEADLKFIRTMLNWAARNWKSAGLPRLSANPIDHFRMPKEKNPTRRTMPYDRFLQIWGAARRLAESPDVPDDERLRMRMFSLAFQIAEVFGRRVGSIGQLTRRDVCFDREHDFANAHITWQAAADKTGQTTDVPIPSEVAKLLWDYCEAMPLPRSGRLFWQIGTVDEPLNTDNLNDLLRKAEHAAGLDHVPHMAWHALRRKWATERKDLPIKDAMAVGGWKDAKTYLGYQQTDPDTMLAVLKHGAKLHSDGWLRAADGSTAGARRAVLPSRM